MLYEDDFELIRENGETNEDQRFHSQLGPQNQRKKDNA